MNSITRQSFFNSTLISEKLELFKIFDDEFVCYSNENVGLFSSVGLSNLPIEFESVKFETSKLILTNYRLVVINKKNFDCFSTKLDFIGEIDKKGSIEIIFNKIDENNKESFNVCLNIKEDPKSYFYDELEQQVKIFKEKTESLDSDEKYEEVKKILFCDL